MPEKPTREMTAAEMREACARYHDQKVAKWLKEAKRHTYPEGRRSDYEDADLARAEEHRRHAAAIRAIPLTVPDGNWPKHADGRNKKIGEMTPEERRAVTSAAATKLQAEMDDPSSALHRGVRGILLGPDVPKTVQ